MNLSELLSILDNIMAEHYDSIVRYSKPDYHRYNIGIDNDPRIIEDLEYKINELKKIRQKLVLVNEKDKDQIEDYFEMIKQLK